MSNVDPLLERRHAYVQLVQAARAGGFLPLPKDDEALADRALLGSLTWTDRVFRVPVATEANPDAQSFHVADARARVDLLQRRLTVGSAVVQIYEGSSFFVVIIPAAGTQPSALPDRAAQVATGLLKLSAPVKFRPVDEDTTDHAVSTDPERPAGRIGEWTRRIDAVLLSGRDRVTSEIALVIYKATYDDMMTLMSDPAAWFEDPLRAASRP